MHREDQKARLARINIVHFGPCASPACILSKPRERNILVVPRVRRDFLNAPHDETCIDERLITHRASLSLFLPSVSRLSRIRAATLAIAIESLGYVE